MSDIAIRVENLGKMYRIGAEEKRPDNLWQATKQLVASPFDYLRRITRPPTEEETLWALKDVSFEVKRGEVVGVIGRNGAGKSTLLKILSRITEPTHGRAEIHGRVGSLLEVGTGFHPELTGRENIYLNGAILGMKREEIDQKFDEMVDFSGVEKFIDTPVKRYSSGMRVRLAFSVAAHLNPEILLVDEVLAVGDAAFQKKCLGKMGDVAKEGRTVLFVSHNMSAILRLCSRALLLNDGRVIVNESSQSAVAVYLETGLDKEHGEKRWLRKGNPEAVFIPIHLRVIDKDARVTNTVRACNGFDVEVKYTLTSSVPSSFRVGIYLSNYFGELIFVSWDNDSENLSYVRQAGLYISRCTIPSDLLNAGEYLIGLNAGIFKVKRFFLDESCLLIRVSDTGIVGSHWKEKRGGVVRPRLKWEIEKVE